MEIARIDLNALARQDYSVDSLLPLVDKAPVQVAKSALVFFAGFGQSRDQMALWLKEIELKQDHDYYLVCRYASNVTAEQAQSYLEAAQAGSHILHLPQQQLETLAKVLAPYLHLEIRSWSFGVRASVAIFDAIAKQVPALDSGNYRAIALAGSIEAVDPDYGIAPLAYKLTLKGYDARVAVKFYHKMFAKGDTALPRSEIGPSAEEQKAELALLPYLELSEQKLRFDIAYAHAFDLIAPYKAIQDSWNAKDIRCDIIQEGHISANVLDLYVFNYQ